MDMTTEQLQALLSGMIIGALTEGLDHCLREWRRAEGKEAAEERIKEVERRVLAAIDGAPLDNIPEHQQVVLVEQTRLVLSEAFRKLGA